MFDAGKLLNQIFGAGGTENRLSKIGGALGGLFNDSVSGVKDGAAAIEQKTGIGAKADEALKNATGKSGGDLLNQAKSFATENKAATGAALGGLGLLLLGTKGGRGLLGNAAALGGLAMVGGLAYKAWQNFNAGKDPSEPGQIEAPPAASPFGETGNVDQDNATAMLVLRAMIAAAACDGVVDNEERSRIIGALEGAGLDVHAAKFLDSEFAKPASIADLAAAANTPALAAQAYTAARIAIDSVSAQEKAFLSELASALKLDAGLVAQIDAGAAAAKG
jgi:uncharacterized membrane protein YebE (DUF533 family)